MAAMSFPQVIVFIVMQLVSLLQIVLFVYIVLSWLINFNVVNRYNQVVATLWQISSSVINPILEPIRRVVPPLGGLDLSALVLIIFLWVFKDWALMRLYLSLG